MRFARIVFLIAGIYGLIVMTPQYFLEARIGRDNPPAITHPEFFYGFIGVTIAWQVLFLLLSRNPVRFRPVMIVAILEKAAFAIAIPILFFQHRVGVSTVVAASIDLILGVLFIVAYVRTPRKDWPRVLPQSN